MKNTYSYVDALNEVLTMALSDQCKEKLTALRDQVAKRNASKSDKPTKTQRETDSGWQGRARGAAQAQGGLQAGGVSHQPQRQPRAIGAVFLYIFPSRRFAALAVANRRCFGPGRVAQIFHAIFGDLAD